MKSLSFIEIQIPVCTLRYGETTGDGTCPAVLGVDSAEKCFNTKNTCPVRASYIEDEVTLRFAKPTSYLPKEIDCIPNVQETSFTPATISLGENLGTRATLSVTFFDEPHSDTGEGFDKYLADRDYNPWEQGTFWGKFRARQPFLRGRNIRLIRGLEGQALEEMETRNFIVESFDGPTPDGKYTLVAKDVLKLVDGDRAMAPRASTGFLVSGITSSAVSATLSPSGVGDTEYPLDGYLVIGGKEIVSFTRSQINPAAGNDSLTLILLHMESTAFDDVAEGGSRTWTNHGASVVSTGTAFGNAMQGGYISTPGSPEFIFANQFTFDIRINANGSTGSYYVFGDNASNGDLRNISIFINTNGTLTATIGAGTGGMSLTSSTNFKTSGVHQVAIVRQSAAVLKLFIDGVQEATVTNFEGASRTWTNSVSVGRSGDYASFAMPSGVLIDEVRYRNGVAQWVTTYTVPSAPYVSTPLLVSTGDVIALTGRGLMNTSASSANAQDRVQLVLRYVSADVADIIYDLMVNYADVPAEYITLSDWQTETATFNGRLYSAVICEPTSVATLISELIQQAGLCIWWDDIALKIRLQVLRGIVTDAARFTPDNYISLSTKEQPDKRISQVLTYFGQINPLKQLSDLDNYRSSSLVIDAEAEEDYGGAVIKKILSRWIPALGRTVADRLGEILISRFRDPPRKLTFDLGRYAGTDVSLGGGYRVASHCFQDETGALVDVPVQVTRLNAPADRFKVEAEEVLFAASNDDPNFHPIVIDANTTNVNLRTVHDSIYGAPTSSTVVECRILAGVYVTSAGPTLPAFDVGSWPSGVSITLIIEGRLQAAGGKGGDGHVPGVNSGATPGIAGGTALYARYAINLELPTGSRLWGGGGGGGGGASFGGLGGPGGGGAGIPPGASGYGNTGGASGTETAGGARGAPGPDGYYGGDGGDPGQAGDSAVFGTSGGAAGRAIDGVSHVTITVTGGDSRGSLIN